VDLEKAAIALDLERRLRAIPAAARTRGIFFNMLRDDMTRRGLVGAPELARFMRATYRSYALYPVIDVVEAFGIAASLVHTDPHEGLRQLFSGTAPYVTSTWYGRVFARYTTPYDAMRWLERSREYVANYGGWRLESRGEGHAIFHKHEEYFWLDALRGGCEGLLRICGVVGTVDLELDDPFNGRLVVRWTPRA
jgi:Protein of unknown function (DUF2378)